MVKILFLLLFPNKRFRLKNIVCLVRFYLKPSNCKIDAKLEKRSICVVNVVLKLYIYIKKKIDNLNLSIEDFGK